MDDRFRAFPQFEQPALKEKARVRHRVSKVALQVFTGDRLQDRFVRALAERRAVSLKEVLESFEFHHRVRKRVRAPVMADLCCGHGLTGFLFALMEREVQQVWCVDHQRPASFDPILEAAVEVGPWVRDKVRYVQTDVRTVELPGGASVIGVHACGDRTDVCLDVAERLGGAVAVMPCCHEEGAVPGLRAVARAHDPALASDIQRTYRMVGMGLDVEWLFIPQAISPKNRILVGRREEPWSDR